jgi:hypothetical protein
MAVDSYIPEPEGIMVVNSINAVASPPQPHITGTGNIVHPNIKREPEILTTITIPISNTINFLVGSY